MSLSRIVRFHELGGPEVLRLEQGHISAPGPDEARIRVRAIGLNRADVMFRRGRYLEKASLPSRLGFEASGVVEALGPGIHTLAIGDAVGVVPGASLGLYGTYADHLVIPTRYLLKQPESLSDQEAAALWMSYLTPYGALVEVANVKAGDWVVISAATSSVGLAAIQIVRQLGARPIATTLTSDMCDALLEASAEAVIATREEPLAQRLMEISGTGIDVAFDAVGGSLVAELAEAMAIRGRIIIHGALSDEPTPFPLKLALRNSLTLRGYVYTEVTRNAASLARAHTFITRGVAEGTIRPKIDKIFTLDEVVEAHRYLESGQQLGKIVMTT